MTPPRASAGLVWRTGRTCPRATWILVGWLLCSARALGLGLPAPGQPAPSLCLPEVGADRQVCLKELRGRIVLLVFGELYNENTVAACRDVGEVLDRVRQGGADVAAYLVVGRSASDQPLLEAASERGVKLPLLHDAGYRALARFGVVVLPSVVVLDRGGQVVLPCAGYPLNFKDLVTDALMYAAGQLSERAFRQRSAAATQQAENVTHIKARRLAALGEQLARRGNLELAVETFQRALGLDERCLPARVGLARCRLMQGDLPQAEAEYRRALEIDPESLEATLGLARIQTLRGGEDLAAARERLEQLLRDHPGDARVVYLAGLVAENSGDVEAAAGYYRRAAEMMLFGPEGKQVTR